MDRRSHTIALIRSRAAAHLLAPRKRLPRQQHPIGIQMDYGRALQPFVVRVHALVKRELYPMLPHALAENAHARGRVDAGVVDLAAKLHGMAREVAGWMEPKQLWWLANNFGKQASDFQRTQLSMATRSVLGVDLGVLEPNVTTHLDAWTAENVSLIRSIPTQYLGEVEDKVLGAVREGTRWEQLSGDLEERYGITSRRADLIARDQVGKLYGKLNEERQTALGVTGYIWRTSMDSRVRDEHEEREGQAYEWNDPPDDGHPGEPVQCRCYAEPDFSDIVEGLSQAP